MTIIETGPGWTARMLSEEEVKKEIRRRARTKLEVSLRVYFDLTLHDTLTAGDIENLTQQGMDALDAVVQGYPPLKDTGT